MKRVFFNPLSRAALVWCLAVIPTGGAVSGTDAQQFDSRSILRVEITDADAERIKVEEFSVAKMNTLPQQEIQTTTPWTEGEQTFVGVKMADFLDALGVAQGEIVLYATNDYSAVASADMLRETGAILAYEMNGALMSPRGKGPLWLIWDYDASSDNRQETIYSLSVWQLDRIHISR